MSNKKKQDIDEYLKEMMGTWENFPEEKLKGAARAGLRNLGIKIPKESTEDEIGRPQK